MEKEVNSKIFLIAIIAIVVIVLISNNFRLSGEAVRKSTPTCYDSDGGKNYNVKGTVTDPYNSKFTPRLDFCSATSGYINEYYCGAYGLEKKLYYCPSGRCTNGACVKDAVNITTGNITTGTTGFRNAYWKCYDGLESYQGYPTSCKSSETWRKYADGSCTLSCDISSGLIKCGVNTFSVSNEC